MIPAQWSALKILALDTYSRRRKVYRLFLEFGFAPAARSRLSDLTSLLVMAMNKVLAWKPWNLVDEKLKEVTVLHCTCKTTLALSVTGLYVLTGSHGFASNSAPCDMR
jgi:hypothetical protein